MMLDNRTLLVSLVLVSALMALSLALASWGRDHDTLKKWAGAMALEAVAWVLFMARGELPYFFSILLAGVVLVSAQSLKVLAIYEFRGLRMPRWQVMLPVVLVLLTLSMLPQDDMRHRIFLGSLLFGGQMLLILHALWDDREMRSGRAWWLLFGATVVTLPLFALRAIVAYFGIFQFSTPESTLAPNPVQFAIFVGMVALGMLGSMGFILMLKEKTDRMIRSLAMIDPLTGIYNRRAFMEIAEKEYAIAHRNKMPLAVLMLDIDFFKKINDDYGHPAGDSVLVTTAQILAAGLRRQDTLGRFGGEEFCALLPNTNEEGAIVLAEKIRSAVAGANMSASGKALSVSISAGITVCQPGCAVCNQSFQQLLNDADNALYQAKRNGRNQSILQPISCKIPAGVCGAVV
jgi:diguanylate cyclase (GGDEF)-like protein